jgi:transcriptional regulator with XRE-family HTH domain
MGTRERSAVIGDRLRDLREQRNLSQGDIESRTGLLRCYISRVENGHTVPSIGTLEKLARAMEVPFYQLFYDGERPPTISKLTARRTEDGIEWGSSGKDAKTLHQFRRAFSRTDAKDLKVLLVMAQKMVVEHSIQSKGGSQKLAGDAKRNRFRAM